MTRRRRYLFSMLLFAATAVWGVAQPTPEEVEQNRHKLETLRKNPEQMARLRDNLQQFLALPKEKQKNLVQMDRDLHDWPAAKKDRFLGVLERYADWLEQLRQQDPAAYKAIKDAPNGESRLVLIRERRDREWIQRSPKPNARNGTEAVPRRTQCHFVAKLRLDEQMRHQRWVIAQRFWTELEKKKEMPCRLSDFAHKSKKKDAAAKESNKVKELCHGISDAVLDQC